MTAGEISEIGTVADDPVPETTGRFDPDGQVWERGVAAEGDAALPETNGRFTADEQGRPTDPPKPPDTQQGKGDGGDGANGGSGGGDSGNSTGSTPSPAPNVSHTSGPANAGNTDAIFGEGTASGSGNVNVFRAVDDDEFQSMEGQFRFGRSGLKYFTTSAESAEDFGSVEMKGLQRPFRVMRGNVPVSRLLGSDVTIGPHFVPGRGWIWEISFEGNPGSPLDFIEWVKEILMLP